MLSNSAMASVNACSSPCSKASARPCRKQRCRCQPQLEKGWHAYSVSPGASCCASCGLQTQHAVQTSCRCMPPCVIQASGGDQAGPASLSVLRKCKEVMLANKSLTLSKLCSLLPPKLRSMSSYRSTMLLMGSILPAADMEETQLSREPGAVTAGAADGLHLASCMSLGDRGSSCCKLPSWHPSAPRSSPGESPVCLDRQEQHPEISGAEPVG